MMEQEFIYRNRRLFFLILILVGLFIGQILGAYLMLETLTQQCERGNKLGLPYYSMDLTCNPPNDTKE